MPGGYTCCVPGCYNNSRNTQFKSFHRFPKDSKQRAIWIHRISRLGHSSKFSSFIPSESHRVCGDHFISGTRVLSSCNPSIKVSRPPPNLCKRINPIEKARSRHPGLSTLTTRKSVTVVGSSRPADDYSTNVTATADVNTSVVPDATLEVEVESMEVHDISEEDHPDMPDHNYCKPIHAKRPKSEPLKAQTGPLFLTVLKKMKTLGEAKDALAKAQARLLCIDTLQSNVDAVRQYSGFSS